LWFPGSPWRLSGDLRSVTETVTNDTGEFLMRQSQYIQQRHGHYE